MKTRFALSAEPLDTAALGRALAGEAAGALVTFEGWVRVTGGDAARPRPLPVTALEYEAWERRAGVEGQRIVDEAVEAFGVLAAACVHRVGRLAVGDVAVWIGVTAAHRDAAFRACRYVIDEVKARVPIWKKEHFADGTSEWSVGAQVAVGAAGDPRTSGAKGPT